MSREILGEVVLDQAQIEAGVSAVANKLNATFQQAVIISVIPGGMLFTADLVRQLNFDIEMDFISCPHRPGDRNNTSDICFNNNINLKGKDIIVIDDAIESGGTMKRLIEYLSSEYEMNSISIATLFVKPGRVEIPAPQYYAYEMESDELLVGYGLPWKDKHRNLPFISKLKL